MIHLTPRVAYLNAPRCWSPQWISTSFRSSHVSVRFASSLMEDQDAKGIQNTYDVAVVGSGPAGIAVLGNILDCNPATNVFWIDPDFKGGRLKKYRQVSSNTKVSLFLKYAYILEPFRHIIESTPKPNAISALESLDPNAGCDLSYAHDLCLMITNGLRRLPNVDGQVGKVEEVKLNSQTQHWSVKVSAADPSSRIININSRKVILCTGSSPTDPQPPSWLPSSCSVIDLDSALDRTKLRETLPTHKDSTIGIVGASHSAIVVIMGLFKMATTTHPHLRVKWFTRRPLTYAKDMGDWILRDNTGLKGASADFAREYLEDEPLTRPPTSRFLERVDCSKNEPEAYRQHLPSCSHLVYAIGYQQDPLPAVQVDNQRVDKLSSDGTTGLFRNEQGDSIPGLLGAGIAFPEAVTDPLGNKESAVGMWKFMKYLQRVMPDYMGQNCCE
ncbi:pyridine nucleotide-disulfide oxidoreductase-domain-containing protein [Exophiala viscosa]|uniref:pyridine nucleotide-disulfide oxidoreductase-domain-containing protein n=1 Tax=Exophiala viscosa TaxID=2486360 RepID=UPI00219D48DD|nr:pyridine nucleotide-disulfide oxidoreductase-domain-containing protein [Exophiala viscosa]